VSFDEPGAEPALEIVLDHPARALDTAPLAAILEAALRDHGSVARSLTVVLTDRETVHDLNRTYLDHDYPTDVVSFALDEAAAASGEIDGEVYVDLDMAAERAPEFGCDFAEEAYRYAVHGVLHLLGHDDATEEDRAAMRALEDRYLAARP
jgi:probable rRNA maturation factor